MTKRTKVLTVRLTEKEYKTLCKKAKRTGWSLSLYTRMCLDFPPLRSTFPRPSESPKP